VSEPMVYQWRGGTRVFNQVDAQVAGERLEAVRIRNNGQLSTRAVLEDARDDESPLHPAFEWSDAVAAEKHREHQARLLIGSIVVVLPDRQDKPPTRAFVNVTTDEQHYTSVGAAMGDTEMRAQVLAQAMRELVRWRARYRELEVLAAVFALIDEKAAAEG
jgi:hypothetical protein